VARGGLAAGNVLGGAWRERASGRSFVVTRRIGPEHVHGRQRVGAIAARIRGAAQAAAVVNRAAGAPFIFLDLETTGLSGGAGTYAFLVGCARFDEDGGFVTEQHLLADFSSERSMLAAVSEELGRASTFVTFNGKSFDAPVLETRYLYHRLESPCVRLAHVDMLHPARRFWPGSNETGCSLVALEGRLLDVRRAGDVPGFEIPARYFQFVRSGDPRPLADVLQHNRLDLLSLAALTARLFHLVGGGPTEVEHPREAFALGQLFERAGLEDRAGEAYEHATTVDAEPAIRAGAYRALALALRRRRQHDAAARHWRLVLDVPRCPEPLVREAVEALAIHHEHRARDLEAARVFAMEGMRRGGQAARGDAARHRLARIERKLASARPPWPASPPLPLSCGSPTSGSRTSS
jgi:uncharacterized protein YprB with RNaseH-like and TPR domain